MKLRRVPILCVLAGLLNVAAFQTSIRSRVEAALDAWTSRAATRDAVLKISRTPVPALAIIAKSAGEADMRRRRAISLLGTFEGVSSEHALVELTDDREPMYRCLAMQSLAELDSRGAIPVLIRKLDDETVCMRMASTDPPRESDVYVSDEAVRLLEQLTKQSFDQESPEGHRLTRPWKEWWTLHGNNPP